MLPTTPSYQALKRFPKSKVDPLVYRRARRWAMRGAQKNPGVVYSALVQGYLLSYVYDEQGLRQC